MRRLLALLVAAAVLAPAAPALAGPDQESILQDDNLLLYRGDRVADRTFDELDRLGVDRVRLSVPWRALAPGEKANRKPSPLRYREAVFHPWDHALRAARARGIDVLMNVTGGAPRWATGRRRGKFVSPQHKPSPREFEAFVRMLGRRWDGDHGHPRADAWSIWNEPNYGAFLQPQWERGRPASPRIYRNLVRAAVRGLKATGHGNDTILLGETSPQGVGERGTVTPMRPAFFMRELFCLDLGLQPVAGPGCAGKLGVTAWAHHPYPILSPPEESSQHPDDVRLADSARLVLTLDAAAAAGRIPRELPIWYTEFGWQTVPDPIRGIPLAQHASWLARAERLTWLDPRVAAMAQFQLKDDPPRRQYRPTNRRYWGTYQAGLRFAGGRAKPAYEAYRLALDAPDRLSPGESLRLWGFVRAARNGEEQRVQLELRKPGAQTFAEVGEPIEVRDRRGYFEVEPPQESGTWRYTWREHTSNAVTVDVG